MFKLLTSITQVFFSPIDTGGTGGNTGSGPLVDRATQTDKEDIIKFLGDDDADDAELIDLKAPVKKEKETPTKEKGGDEEDDAEDELKAIEEELEEPTDEQLELVTPAARREILKKYPNLFKDFPYLEKAYYREQQFTEMFPTINDAKEAADKASTLDRFEQDIMKGDTEKILQAVKKESPGSFHKLVDNYLGVLSKVDNQAYLHVVGNTIKHTIAAMVGEARRTGNENLQNAALLLNQFTFGTSDYTPPQNLAKENPEGEKAVDEVKQREQRFLRQQFETTRDDLNTRVGNALKATIAANIDPRDSMSDYVKRNASREALETVSTLISKDTRFKNLLDRLWENAAEKNFDKASTDRIRAAYISKAKTLLPSVIKKARNDALKGMGKRVKEEKDSEESEETTRESRSDKSQKDKEKPSSQRDGRKGKITNPKDIPAGMRSVDFLMQD